MNRTTVTKDGVTLTIERTINAPKDKVWQAYTDADVFITWWGPDGWSTRVKHFDVTSGGHVLYGMKCEDKNQGDWYGKESWGKTLYQSVTPKDAFAYTDCFCDENGIVTEGLPTASISMRFEEVDGKTKITSVGTYESEAALQQVLEMGMEEGIKQTFDRLEALLG